VLAETLAVLLVVFAGQIISHGLGHEPESKSITTQSLLISALPYIGWIVLIPCLLTRDGPFAWNLPQSGKEWARETAWAVALLGAVELASFGVAYLAAHARVVGHPTYWHAALQDTGTRLAFTAVAPVSALYQEMLCRVYMQSRLTRILNGHPIIVVLISAWLFMAVHAYAPLQSLLCWRSDSYLGRRTRRTDGFRASLLRMRSA
jgi:membrane protease YdiL (CAAX protease family)